LALGVGIALIWVAGALAWTAQGVVVSYTGPGDIVAFSSWYGLRAYSGTYAAGVGKLINIRNTATNETCDVPSLTTGGFGLVSGCSGSSSGDTVAVFCALSSGTCTVTEAYDQVGTNHVSQSTAANQPALTASCLGSFYCIAPAASTNAALLGAGNVTPATGVVALAGVAQRTSGTNPAVIISENGVSAGSGFNQLSQNSSANNWRLSNNTTSLVFSATDSKWHAANGNINGASTVANLDGTETTGSVTGVTVAGATRFARGATSTTNQVEEAGYLDNSTFSSGNRTSLCQNEQAYYGASNFGATC